MKNYTIEAKKLTNEEIKNDSKREYNPTTWERIINDYSKYQDVEFFKVDKGNGYDYDRFYVVYTIHEGLRLFSSLSYSSSLTNGGFRMAFIKDYDEKFEKRSDNKVSILIKGFGEEAKETLNNSKEARKWMIDKSKKYSNIFTKE